MLLLASLEVASSFGDSLASDRSYLLGWGGENRAGCSGGGGRRDAGEALNITSPKHGQLQYRLTRYGTSYF
jgi:hypothetical protein